MFRKQTPYLYLAIPLLAMALFFVVPLVMAFGISLLDYGSDLYHPRFAGLDNYLHIARSPMFWQSMVNTLVFVVGIIPALIALPLVMAVLLNCRLKGIGLFRVLIYLPVVVSMVVVGIAWKWLYAQDGLINYVLSFFGIEKIGWLINPDIALYSVMIVVIWKALAYYMMMYLANLQSLSTELYQAAEIDGAGTFQKHWHVTLPHLKPTVIMVALIATIGGLKAFTEIYVMTRGGPVGSTRTLVYYIFDRAFSHLDLGIASAAGFVLMAMLLGISMLQIRHSSFWEKKS